MLFIVKRKEKKDEAVDKESESLLDMQKELKDADKALKNKDKNKQIRKGDYGVSRGVDFKGVDNVINFDFPLTVKAYIHRVGRTARAGARGKALSLANDTEIELLEKLRSYQTERFGEARIQELAYDLNAVEAFRYRVEDVSRSVTKLAIKQARLAEIRAEVLNSKKLSEHFGRNPNEIYLLKHAKVLRPKHVRPHLKHVPDYLLMDPSKMQQTTKSESKAGASSNISEIEDTNIVSRNLKRKLHGKGRIPRGTFGKKK